MRFKKTFVMIKSISIIASLIAGFLWFCFYHQAREAKIRKTLSLKDKKINEISKYRLIYNPRKKIFEKILDLDEEDVEVITIS